MPAINLTAAWQAVPSGVWQPQHQVAGVWRDIDRETSIASIPLVRSAPGAGDRPISGRFTVPVHSTYQARVSPLSPNPVRLNSV
ncbi:hypothetical protein PsW64_04069 [Pseudovibrio sp. W64]|uniref:hypothetical protein n=1 Tax=unclassified Pseudovibrio TaxID=2627060 RepID=UPI0007AEE12B|nr:MULTISPECIES: hypothetical protein [unclassified Pseudovibrio]KZK78430.1 hypothetical protein PsW64_04069 [Pseudovibrio sp. W64]KZK84249.1 hypothetical protein PsAD13_02288 [Pseudovibrio sp. Ad13]KZK90566.1 hypothetical protein PsAD46_02187 [Pseudovibrio sp. Ad46]KZK92711.1 hypothetical protein PsAD5_03432 [Pseudovibrio sp. Ad5]KZL13350.1 hypothetical protein PsAD26_02120 [Pseudovibrio sp. Ad26]